MGKLSRFRSGYPGPVLGPYGDIIGKLPGKRGGIYAGCATDNQFDEISSIELHNPIPLMMSNFILRPRGIFSVLFVAHKAGIVLFEALLGMTLGTIIHLHAIPGIHLVTGDIPSPDVDAITTQPILFIYRQIFFLGPIPVAGFAVGIPHLDMGYMRKIDTVRLPGIDQPGHFFFLCHIIFQKF